MTMKKTLPRVLLREVLKPISRPETVNPEATYNILGAHWYAQGLYTKDVLTGAGIQAGSVYRVERGDFVYNRLFGWKGSFAIATEGNHGCYVSNEFPCFIVDTNRADGRFLWRYFSRPSVWEDVLALSTGGTPTSRNRLKEEQFLTMEVPLPPLDEQRRIVSRIEELAAKIEEARALRLKAEGDVEAFVVSTHLRLAGKRVRTLDQVLVLDEDAVPTTTTGQYPQVGVKGFGGGLFSKSTIAGTETTYKSFNRLYEGALVLSQVKGWEGAVAVCERDLAGWFVSPEYRTFRCVEGEARSGYLTALVRTEWFWGRLGQATRGVGARRERTRPEQFLSIEIPMPDVERQKLGAELFSELHALKKMQADTAAELDALMPSILSKAFSGEL